MPRIGLYRHGAGDDTGNVFAPKKKHVAQYGNEYSRTHGAILFHGIVRGASGRSSHLHALASVLSHWFDA